MSNNCETASYPRALSSSVSGIEQANASQHLAVLRAKNILVKRKAGNQVLYSVRDPLIVEVLDIMRGYFHTHLSEALATLKEIDKAEKSHT